MEVSSELRRARGGRDHKWVGFYTQGEFTRREARVSIMMERLVRSNILAWFQAVHTRFYTKEIRRWM